MIESDQYFIMVEDELHDIAHQFTRSLHRAEYQRLQALAASKNASSISEIQRATNGFAVNRKQRSEGTFSIKASKIVQHIALGKEAGGASSGEEEKEQMSQWEGTNLAVLMLGPGQRQKDLSAQWEMKATTRAAAGFHRATSEQINSSKSRNQSQMDDSDICDTKTLRQLLKPRKIHTKDSVARDINRTKTLPKKQGTFREDRASDTEDNDDDLDIPALRTTPKPPALLNPTPARISPLTSVKPKEDNFVSPLPHSKPTGPSPATSSGNGSAIEADKYVSLSGGLSVFDDFLSMPTLKNRGGVFKGKAAAALAKKREMKKSN